MPVAVVVGAGPAGCVAAAALAKRGWSVHVYERGEGAEWAHADTSRVYPLMLCSRATRAMEDAGLPIPSCAIRCDGVYAGQMRVPLRRAGGTGPHAYRYLTNRVVLAYDLYCSVRERYAERVTWHWGHALNSIDFDARVTHFNTTSVNGSEQGAVAVPFDLLVGADGVGSAVRRELERAGTGFSSHTVYAPISTYKTFRGLLVSPQPEGPLAPAAPAADDSKQEEDEEEGGAGLRINERQGVDGVGSDLHIHLTSPSTAAVNASKMETSTQAAAVQAPPSESATAEVTHTGAAPCEKLDPVPGFSSHSPLSHVYFSFKRGGSALAFIKEQGGKGVSGMLTGRILSWEEGELASMLAAHHPNLPASWRAAITAQVHEGSGQEAHSLSRITQVSQLHGPNCVLVGDAGHSVTSSLGHGCNAALESVWVLSQCLDRLGWDSTSQLSQLPAAYNAARLADVHALQHLELAMSLVMGGTSSVATPWAQRLTCKLLVLPCEIAAILGHKLLPSLFPTPGYMREVLADARISYAQVLNRVRTRSAVVLAGAAAVVAGVGWAVLAPRFRL